MKFNFKTNAKKSAWHFWNSLYQQIVGRGLRLSDDKKDCYILDYTGMGHDIYTPEISDKSFAHILRVIDETKALISEHIDYKKPIQNLKNPIPNSLISQLSALALLVGIRIPENENEKNVVLRAMKVLRQRILYYTNHPDIVLGGEGIWSKFDVTVEKDRENFIRRGNFFLKTWRRR